MKKLIAAVLVLSLLLSLVSCSSSLAVTEEPDVTLTEEATAVKEETEEAPITLPQGFSAGFAQKVVNPKNGVGLGGHSTHETRLSKMIMDDLKLSAVAISDGEQIFLFFTLDVLAVSEKILNTVTGRISNRFEGLSIPAENVMINASHSHSAPAIYAQCPGITGYLKTLYAAFDEVTEKALRDLSPSTLLAGEAHTENLNWVRRYISKKDGSFLGNWPSPEMSAEEAYHETDPDTQLQVLCFDRGEKKDIVLVNWQCHPTTVGSATGGEVSADWVGAMRDAVEENEEVHCIYFQGASGNLVPDSGIIGEKDNSTNHILHGKDISLVVSQALNNAKPVETGAFYANRIRFEATRKNGEEKNQFFMSVFSVGDVAFATVPCEFFDTLGMYVKDNSPFKTTFMCAYTNGTNSYVPTSAAMDNGGYEPKQMRFVKGTGEEMAQKLVDMLNSIPS